MYCSNGEIYRGCKHAGKLLLYNSTKLLLILLPPKICCAKAKVIAYVIGVLTIKIIIIYSFLQNGSAIENDQN